MISEKEIEDSVTYLLATADATARARASRVVLEHGLKRVKALEMQKALYAKTLGDKETAAYSSEAYGVALEGLQQAIFEDERHRAMRTAHEAKIEAWRTAEATRRSVRL